MSNKKEQKQKKTKKTAPVAKLKIGNMIITTKPRPVSMTFRLFFAEFFSFSSNIGCSGEGLSPLFV